MELTWRSPLRRTRSALDYIAIEEVDSRCEKKGSYEHVCNCAGSQSWNCWNPQIQKNFER